eukprot:GGOE01041837.1.p1 GENE.GGOE01041837.1~~GGOE01041837.1.p1  ORF type:complete len:545 (+),score=150.03 GGOE01041837.1:119-1753(+)
MGLHGWLLLDSAMGQHLLSESYTPAFGLPFPGGDPTALGMSLAALVFALKQNADCVFPQPPPEPSTADRVAEWRQHARDPHWLDPTPNSSSVLTHMVGQTRLVFFQHQCFDLLCVVASSVAVPSEASAFVAETLCKRFLRLSGGEVPSMPVAPSTAHRTFRPMVHSVLRSLARRFCCARVASTLWGICRSPWVLLTYSPPLTSAINTADVPVLKPVPRATALAFVAWRRQQSPPEGATPPDTERDRLLERCRGLRGASLLYLNVEEDLDLPRGFIPGTIDLLSPNSAVRHTVPTNTSVAIDEEQPSDDDASAERTIMRSVADVVEHLDGPVLASRIADSLRRVGTPVPHLLAVLHQFEWDHADASFRVLPDGPRRSQLAQQLRDTAAKVCRSYQVGSSSSFAGRSCVSLQTAVPAKHQRLRTALQRHFSQTDEAVIVATLLDLTMTTAKLRRLCRSSFPIPASGAAEESDDLDIEFHLGAGQSSVQIKVLKQGDMYLTFPIESASLHISSALLKPLLMAEMASSEHIFRLLYQQKVPTFVDVDA